jgi:small-conductance mechanosensitive channel
VNVIDVTFYHNMAADWAIALVLSAAVALFAYSFKRLLLRRLARRARETGLRPYRAVADILSSTHALFLLVVALYLAAQYLTLPAKAVKFVDSVVVIALLVQAAIWANRGIADWLAYYIQEKRETDAAGATTVGVLGFVARVAVWALVTLMVLGNLGFNITALVASLGIGGIAVALAVQNILGDIFASLSIALDKPFVIGDFIVVGDVLGTVEYIGLKTTRIRSLSGEQIVFSNAELLRSRVRNYKRMNERRALFSFGVVYQTPYAKLARIPGMVREIIEQQERARFDRAHFLKYGESSLDFEVVYYVLDPDYNVYMDIQQAINLALFRRFEDEGIDFAYPTRTIHIDRNTPAPPAATGETA